MQLPFQKRRAIKTAPVFMLAVRRAIAFSRNLSFIRILEMAVSGLEAEVNVQFGYGEDGHRADS